MTAPLSIQAHQTRTQLGSAAHLFVLDWLEGRLCIVQGLAQMVSRRTIYTALVCDVCVPAEAHSEKKEV